MAYRAYIVGAQENPVPSDSMTITIVFRDAPTNREVRKDYKVVAGTPVVDIKALIVKDRDELRQLDVIRTGLVPGDEVI